MEKKLRYVCSKYVQHRKQFQMKSLMQCCAVPGVRGWGKDNEVLINLQQDTLTNEELIKLEKII